MTPFALLSRAGSITLVLVSVFLLTSCASPCNSFGVFLLYPLAAFDPHTYRGHDGSGPGNAVVLDGPKGERETAEAESAYIYKMFSVESKRADRENLEIGKVRYHIVIVKTNDGKTKKVWFDVTSAAQPGGGG